MPKIVLILFLALPVSLFGESSLLINFESCNGDQFAGLPKNIKVLKNEVFDAALTDSMKGQFSVYLKNIDPGTYRFIYSNLWGIEQNDSIIIDAASFYRLKLCMDIIKPAPENFSALVDKITTETPFILEINSDHHEKVKRTFIVKLKEGRYVVDYSAKIYSSNGKLRKIKKSTPIEKKELNRIRQLEYEMQTIEDQRIKSEGVICTGKAWYDISLGNEKRKYRQLSCGWYGFEYFYKRLFDR